MLLCAHVESGFQRLMPVVCLVLQQFMEQITEQGEWSVIYIDGKYRRAVLKSPKDGNYLTQVK